MKVKFTRSHLMMKLYEEMEPTENQAIEEAFDLSFDLREEYEGFQDVKEVLDKVTFSPSDVAVDSILAYSRKLNMLQICPN